MKTISNTALQKAILAVEAERARHPAVFAPNRTQLARLRKGRPGTERSITTFLAGNGFAVDRLQVEQDRVGALRDRLVAEHKAEALGRPRDADAVHAGLAARGKALAALAARADFFPLPSVSLATPFQIWTTPLADLTFVHTAPFASFAKFRFQSSTSRGTQKVGFFFAWTNASDDFAVIDATTFLSATGHLKAHAPGGFFTNTSRVDATALLTLWTAFPAPTTSATTGQWIGQAGAIGDVWGGGTGGTSVAEGVSLSQTFFSVSPRAVVVFEVGVKLEWDNDDGDIDADFATGAFRIACPVVVVALRNGPIAANA